MATLPFPDGIDEAHAGAPRRPRGAFAPLLLLGAILLAALLGLFGGHAAPLLRASGSAATLEVRVPTTLRSGMFFEMRAEVHARRDVEDAVIAIPPSLWRDMTINTSLPEASAESFEDGSFRLHYGPLKAGDRIVVKFDGQINPDLFAGTRGDVALLDGKRRIASLPVRIRVLP